MSKKMKLLLLGIIAISMIILSGCKQEAKAPEKILYSTKDAQGTVVNFNKKPEKIISYISDLDGIIIGMVPPEKILAVSYFADDPKSSNISPLVKNIKHRLKNPSTEEIFSLQPDLVLVPNWAKPELVDSLRDLGIKVIVCNNSSSVTEIRSNIITIANAIGESNKGLEMLKIVDEKLNAIEEKVNQIPFAKRKTVALISLIASYGGEGSAFDDMCKYAGVINGISKLGIRNGQVLGKERLIEMNPDVIILPAYNDHGKFDNNKYAEEFLTDPSLQTLKAVKEKQFVYPREEYIYNVTQDFVFGVQEIAYLVYGDEFKLPEGYNHISVVDFK